jgi:hypothetical protein
MRLYQPQDAILDDTYHIPPITKAASQTTRATGANLSPPLQGFLR